ncbi:MAG: hypothetical protein KGL16_03235, partial [Acidobacteriota bacterium]|nr:hypothetical protein [Acidobacteriota bacterium]
MASRDRIERLLDTAWERRVTLVVAGGGYGKTTAVRRLAAGENARWLSLKPADRDVQKLAGRVARALDAGSQPGLAGPADALGAIDRRSLAERQAAVVCESLDSGEADLLLVLDDLDQLLDDDSASQFLSTLCLQAPPRLHLVLSGRRLPALGLGAVRGRGELIELDAADLAFTEAETESLLIERLGQQAQQLATECWSLTAGWAAALRLITDRLERVAPENWPRTVGQLRRRRPAAWLEFAAEVIEREQPRAQRALSVASIVPAVEADLLAALAFEAAASELDSLEARGLLVAAGENGARTLSPVLAEAMKDRLDPGEAEDLRRLATAWFERCDRLGEALECAASGPRQDLLSLIERRGERLVERGFGSRLVELLRELGIADDPELAPILGQALVAVGQWDDATEVFRQVQRRASGVPLAAAVAWRLGALLYLRSDLDAAREVLSA